MGVNVGTAIGYLDLDISGFLSGLSSAQSEAQRSTKNIATQIGNGFQSAGKTLTTAGSTLTKKVTMPAVGLGTAIVKTSADFESAMAKVQAISGATGKDFDDLNAKAREMGAKTKFSASEAAEAFQYMAMAGWDVENMMGGISGVMNLAAASGEELGTVSDIVTDAMTAFGLSASGTSKVLKDGLMVEVDNTTRFVDALAAASNSSNTNVAMLGESFKYVAPVAGALGYSVEDTAVALGLMANQGIKASQSGTALRSLLVNMANPTKDMVGAMNDLGLSLENEDGSMKSLMEVMQDLRKSFGEGYMDAEEFAESYAEIQEASAKVEESLAELQEQYARGEITESKYNKELKSLTKQQNEWIQAEESLMVSMYGVEGAQKAQYAAVLAGKMNMGGLLAIINTTEDDFNSLSDSIYNAAGTSQNMADIMNNNLKGQMTIMKSSLEELALQFGEILLPVMKDFIAWVQRLIARFQEMSPEQKEQIAKWAAIAAAIGPVILILGKLVTSIGNVITVFGKIPGMITNLKSGFGLLKNAIAGVSAPVVAIIAAIGTLVAAFKYLWDTNESFRESITAIWEGIKSKFETFGQGIVDRLNELGFDFENITEVLKAIWDGFCEFLAPIFEAAFQVISSVLGSALDILTGIFDIFVGLFTGNWEQCWDGVKGVFGGIWDAIVGIFSGAMNALKGVANTVLGWFGTSWEKVWGNVSNFFINIWEGIKSFFQGVVEFFTPLVEEIVGAFQMAWEAIQAAWDYVEPYFMAIWEGIKAIFSVVIEVLGGFFSNAWEAIKAVWNTVVGYFQMIWENIKAVFSVVKEVLFGFFNTAWEAIKAVWNSVVKYFEAVWAGIKAVFAVVKDVLTGDFSGAWEAIKNAWSKAGEFFQSIWDGIKNVFGSVATWFGDSFAAAWNAIKNVFSNVKDFFLGLWNIIKDAFTAIGTKIGNAISDAVKAGINGVIGMIEGIVNGFIKMINGAIGIINLIPGVHLKKLELLTIPRLATGGVLKKGQVGLLEGSGAEAVVPLEKNTEWLSKVAKMLASMLIIDITPLNPIFESLTKTLDNAVGILKNLDTNVGIIVNSDAARASAKEQVGYVSYDLLAKKVDSDRRKDNDKESDDDKPSGNTYVFYTTKSIDEIEAARQMQMVERDMAEGFI